MAAANVRRRAARAAVLPAGVLPRAAVLHVAILHAAALLVVLCCASPLAAQTGGAPAAGDAPAAGEEQSAETIVAPASRTVATVNGEVITSSDISQNLRALRRAVPSARPEELVAEARRVLAEEILLAAEARRLGMKLDDREVAEYWESRFGETPDFDRIAAAAGTTAERQRELARRAALAELYMLHKVGLRHEQARVVPVDPVLARWVTITPSQLREYFRRERAAFDAPATVSFRVFPCPDAATAEATRAAIAAGTSVPDGVPVVPDSCPVDQLDRLFPEPLARLLAHGGPGALSEPTPTDRGVLLLQVTGRTPGEPAEFAAVQRRLEDALRLERVLEAREALVGRLEEDAAYWPPDLFEAADARPDETAPVLDPDPPRPDPADVADPGDVADPARSP